MSAKQKMRKVIRFPTGVTAYMDENGRLQGSPAHVIANLSHREHPEELNAFEVFVKNFLTANSK